MGKKGLEDLQVWLRAKQLAVVVCKEAVPRFPPEEKYCLGLQLRRAVQSIPANIAEAYGRFHSRDAIRFCYIARGSLEETLSHLILARELDYLAEQNYRTYRETIREIGRMLNGYIDYLRKEYPRHVDQDRQLDNPGP